MFQMGGMYLLRSRDFFRGLLEGDLSVGFLGVGGKEMTYEKSA